LPIEGLGIMSNVELCDVGHENAVAGRNLVAASAAAQFYNFAGRCMDWAQTTRSLQEREIYTQMGLQWLAAGAQLQTFMHLLKQAKEETTQGALAFSTNFAAHDGELGARPSVSPCEIGGLHDATDV
jgi:hypothetical protein